MFIGDLNDTVHVMRLLREAGFTESFTAGGAPLMPTHPVLPTAPGTPEVIDWQFRRGPVRAMNSQVGEFFYGEIAPSGPKPLVTTYGLE